MALIELRDIVKTYGHGAQAFHALAGINLTIAAGEFVAIMGASGSGKSTALNILGCLDRPSSGTYQLGEIAVQDLNSNQRALLRRQFLGFIFQGFHLLARTSALENVELPLLYRGLPSHVRREQARAALNLVGLSTWEKNTPAELSGGQQQRVAIARAIATQPAVLLADEPTGNLDSTRSHEIMQLLQNLNTAHGITTIMVTHESDMAAYARRTIRFRDGLIAADTLHAEKVTA